ncbi:hypothetical protein NM680_10780 [Paracoccus sp. PS-1]|uniref:hypothetical protein n=1 Tax=Paracoccus sp. PS1 TaxID=2963938 RepID=UPI0027E3CBD8|nr:hypothetical protein [Paracoccus sp. PS1]MDQ7262278.1 hypothetical protein [Paracoccus sp. PS1]
MKRRQLLKLAPVALAAGAVPALAVEESRIIVLFRRHQELVDQAEAYDSGTAISDNEDADEIMDRLFYNEIFQIRDEIMATPCQTPRDFAAKVIVATCRGAVIPDWDAGDLFKEARALVA